MTRINHFAFAVLALTASQLSFAAVIAGMLA